MIASRFHQFYFIGIGGIGMSAIARLLLLRGFAVAGYDKTPSALTQALEAEGAQISYVDDVDSIPTALREDPDHTLVIYTPAIPAEQALPSWFRAQDYTLVKRAKALGMLTADGICLAVAGTHGKTTTSCLIAHLMHQAGLPFTALLGGISANYNTNLLSTGTDYFVTEADEFDRSFLELSPAYAAITSMDADHLDIYGDAASIEQAYSDFAARCTNTLVYRTDMPLQLPSSIQHLSYGPAGQVQAAHVRVEAGAFVFDYIGEVTIQNIRCGMPGLHNIENALAAISLVLQIGLSPAQIRSGMASFKGVKRRFEKIWESDKQVYVDDYAHHPTEIAALLASIRLMYPGRKVLGIFQPHLFSRTRDFMPGFAAELSKLDACWLLDIYPAREKPIEGITAAALQAQLSCPVRLMSKEALLPALAQEDIEVLLTIGAGDIDRLVQPIGEILKRKEEMA